MEEKELEELAFVFQVGQLVWRIKNGTRNN